MPCKSHISFLFLLNLVMVLLSPSCSDDDVNLNPRMEKADLPDEIPYTEMGSGKILFTRGYISYLIDIDNHSVSELIIDPVGRAVTSPDGETVAFVCIEEKLHLWNIINDNHKTTPFGNGDFNLLSWSPDSETMYFSTAYTNKLYELNVSDQSFTRTMIREFPQDIFYLSPFSASTGGDFAVYISANFFNSTIQSSEEFACDGIYTMNPKGEECICVSKHEGDPSRYSHCSPKWSPDGETIAYLSITNHQSTSIQEIILIDKDGSNARSIVEKEIPSASVPFEPWAVNQINISLCWSPDGTKIAFIGMEDEMESHLYMVDVFTQELIQVTTEQGVEDRSVCWSE